jgi:hypothetical protein
MIRKYLILLCLAGVAIFNSLTLAYAQNDTSTVVTRSKQSEKQITIRKRYNPRKALLMSAALPGLGQAYTKKYWKIPIIYTGAAILGYFIIDNNRNYIIWRDRYIIQRTATESGLEPPLLNPANNNLPFTLNLLKRSKDYYRRNRDFSVILSGLLYVLNLADANVTAHLKDFDLSEDLSMSVQPSFYQPGALQPSTGITLTFNFK